MKRKAIRIDDTLSNPLKELNEHLDTNWIVFATINISNNITYIILER